MNETATPPARIRRLGFAEARMHLLHTRLHGTAQGAAVLHLRGELDPDALAASAAKLAACHQMLRSSVCDYSGELWFVQRETPGRVLAIVPREDESTWLAALEEVNSRPLSDDEGAWKLVLVTESGNGPDAQHELIFIAHHALIDGTSTAVFFNQLLAAATSRKALVELPPRPLPPSVEELSSAGVSWAEFVQRQREFSEAAAHVATPEHAVSVPVAGRRTRLVPFVIDEKQTAGLSRRAQESNISLSAYVSALLLLAVHRAGPPRTEFVLGVPFSLRPFCGDALQEGDLGCYLSVLSTVQTLAEGTKACELAQRIQTALLMAAVSGARNPETVEYGALDAQIRSLAEATSFRNDIGIMFLEPELRVEYPGLSVEAFYGSANRVAGNVTAVLQVVALRSRLFCTLNYAHPVQTDEWIEEVVRTLCALAQEDSESAA